MLPFIAVYLFLCWGSFLNVLGVRLINGTSILGRSHCIHCNTQLAWYDLIPILSWLALRGRCRTCNNPISLLYPLIELLSTTVLLALFFTTQPIFFAAYFIFFSALIVTIRSDLETMLISRFVTLYLIPFAFIAAYCNLLPLHITESIIGAAVGYTLMQGITLCAAYITGKECMGQGDTDLVAFIGACTGLIGVWSSIVIGSTLGSCIGGIYMLYNGQGRETLIPFGPFLAIGAIIHVLFNIQAFFQYL